MMSTHGVKFEEEDAKSSKTHSPPFTNQVCQYYCYMTSCYRINNVALNNWLSLF